MPPLAAGNGRAGAGLENVIRRCLAKKRHDRYPSAEALAAALRELDGAEAATRRNQAQGANCPGASS